MSGAFRIPGAGHIDRAQPLAFRFNSKSLQGCAGDTLASALLANGVHLVARSFKYHRPRGMFTAGNEEPNAIVQLERGPHTEPNLRATEIELYAGLEAASVNCFPSVDFDLGVLNRLASAILVAGFYNKTFMWPKSFWKKFYEPVLRNASGLGVAPDAPDPDIYDRLHWHCDVLVVGAGPAGLSAALEVARQGLRTVLIDEAPEPGGTLLQRPAQIGGIAGAAWAARAAAELDGLANVLVLRRTSVFGYYDNNYLMALERRTDHLGPGRAPGIARKRLWHFRAARVILATGAHERPIVFGNNDLPGIMLANAACTYATRYGVALGRRGVAFVNNDHGYALALDTQAAAGNLSLIVDARPAADPELARRAAGAGVRALQGHVIARALGGKRVRGVDIRTCAGANAGRVECDHLLISGGISPAVHLFSQAPGTLRYDARLACFLPDRAGQAVEVAGALNARLQLASALADGKAAAARTLAALGRAPAALAPSAALTASSAASAGFVPPATVAATAAGTPAPGPVPDELHIEPLWSVQSLLGRKLPGKHFIDLQNDVTESDIRLAAREGFRSVEHAKRYTTTGMATDQGKTSNVTGLAILAEALGKTIPEVGTTTFRPPFTPVTFGALAGRDRGTLSDPVRITPMHAWHAANGAVFEDVGQWKRPWYFPLPGEDMQAAVARETRALRTTAGVMDATTLGKIDIQGADAAEFLNRVYTNAWTKLAVGSCRYGLMCKPDGMMMDDGVTARLAPDRFLMTTTTGNAARVLDWLEEWLQTEWPGLKVYCTSVTEQWSTVAIVGPNSRKILQALAPDMDLSNAAFPFMTFREGEVAGLRARVFRISFSGELSYEVNVPSWHGLALWQAVIDAGKAHGLTPYGTETMHVARAEKGYIIVGQETDATVTPQDLGLAWAVSTQKDFIGKRSFARVDTRRADRKQLVGLLPHDKSFVAAEGSHLVARPARAVFDPASGSPSIGHITSSYFSPNLGSGFALALIANGRALRGQTVYCVRDAGPQPMTVGDPVFFDPEGKRRDGID
ncbi:MAG: sarcosine oxidase subunit alpha family protein [Betaproteobacteria bacterium]|nr:sarcosine oxidase subunit alpha family protein [Betaproteobacteria bacterium]